MTSGNLVGKKCVPCKVSQPALKDTEIEPFHQELGKSWVVENAKKLVKTFHFKDFATALDFVNDIAPVAEAENHHPDIKLTWGKVTIELYTHKIDGLSENDFILAAKIDVLYISDTGNIS